MKMVLWMELHPETQDSYAEILIPSISEHD